MGSTVERRRNLTLELLPLLLGDVGGLPLKDSEDDEESFSSSSTLVATTTRRPVCTNTTKKPPNCFL
jgi:hypothetical protein